MRSLYKFSSLFFVFFWGLGASASFMPDGFKAEFRQFHKSSLSGKMKESRGKLFYQSPSWIRIETQSPSKTVYVGTPKKSWYYRAPFIEGERGELTISGEQKQVLTRFFQSLQQGLKSNKSYQVQKQKEKKAYQLVFSEKTQKALGLKSATLKFAAKKTPQLENLSRLRLHYRDGRKVLFAFKDFSAVNAAKEWPEGTFTFTPPPNTNVVEP